ncbi:hypothetical protein OG275_34245 [Streptomyces niveus]|uniref:hypothetical protein n=1 Tax=Streptomyces niveus TaxID=193462 RepID=UPI002E2F690D|nr:hypothetical protein [Streptomyces niveus]
MYLVQRDGVWLASHYRKPGEKPISHESDEHLARKERVAKDSEDHGFHADIESRTADGHAHTRALMYASTVPTASSWATSLS